MMEHTMSMFDPATSVNINLNWVIFFMPTLIPFSLYWSSFGRANKFMIMIMKSLHNHWHSMTKINLASLTLFMLMASWNLMGLLPYTFTPTTQLLTALSFALPFWLSPLIHLKIINPQISSAHLTPSGLGNLFLGMAMSLTELISLFLRPITLTLRLTINMTAGHLMLGLISTGTTFPSAFIFALSGVFAFIMLELAVAIIQAYVFSMLSLLYSKEG